MNELNLLTFYPTLSFQVYNLEKEKYFVVDLHRCKKILAAGIIEGDFLKFSEKMLSGTT